MALTNNPPVALIPPRWAAMKDTYWAPYFHRNCMSEFAFPVIRDQNPSSPFNQMDQFAPFGALLNNSMVAHGMDPQRHQEARDRDTSTPQMIDDGPFSIVLVESENMMAVSEYALKNAGKDVPSVPKL